MSLGTKQRLHFYFPRPESSNNCAHGDLPGRTTTDIRAGLLLRSYVLLSMLATRNNLTRGFHAARDKQSVVHTTTVLKIGMRVCGVVVPNAGPTKQSCTPEQDDEKQWLTNDTSHHLGTSTQAIT